MTDTTKLLILAAGLGIGVPLIAEGLDQEKGDLATKLTYIGLVGTAIGIPLGMWAVPAFSDKPWVAAVLLTGASYISKAMLLPHGEHAEPEIVELPAGEQELAGVY